MNAQDPYKPSNAAIASSTGLGIFVHALTTVYAFLCFTFATFIATGIAFLHPNGLNLLPNMKQSQQLLIAAFVSLSLGATLAFATWRSMRTSFAGALATFAVTTTLFTLSLVGISLLLQIELGNFSVIPQDWDSFAPAHFAMNLFAACASLTGMPAIYLEIRNGRALSSVVVAISTVCCLCFLLIFWAIILW